MKKFITLFLLSASSIGFLAACQKPVQTVDWYREHDKDREVMIAKCNANPGELADDPNCINAKKASTLIEDLKRGTNELRDKVGHTGS